jgi:ribulose-phosphate 3-epimerase
LKLSPSVLAADLANLAQAIELCEEANADFIHFDVMDGHFVPNLTFGAPVIRAVRSLTRIPFDVHLMVENPSDYVAELARFGCKIVSFHIETTHHGPRLAAQIQEAGMGASVALNPGTSLVAIEEVLPVVENVLVMGVNPGFYGQDFIPHVTEKIEKLSEYRDEREMVFTIEVDGGVSVENAPTFAEIGVDIVVAGKAFFTVSDPLAAARMLKGPAPKKNGGRRNQEDS